MSEEHCQLTEFAPIFKGQEVEVFIRDEGRFIGDWCGGNTFGFGLANMRRFEPRGEPDVTRVAFVPWTSLSSLKWQRR